MDSTTYFSNAVSYFCKMFMKSIPGVSVLSPFYLSLMLLTSKPLQPSLIYLAKARGATTFGITTLSMNDR